MPDQNPICRCCLQPFEPDGLAIYCSPGCASEGNSRPREQGVKTAEAGGGFAIAVVKESPGWSEAEFQEAVCKRAEELGWKWFHVRITRQSKAGWFDLVLWRDRVVFAELKDETGTATADQLNLQDDFKLANAEVYLWRPSDWSEIEEVLQRGRS